MDKILQRIQKRFPGYEWKNHNGKIICNGKQMKVKFRSREELDDMTRDLRNRHGLNINFEEELVQAVVDCIGYELQGVSYGK
ncbi:hypothetical protein LCGC14_2603990 [marine sediment metagenome]|uniref:Uncharacterized protein n=1 Tax=marine sediment metagenome TaxID=412755 RepID=A0A0F9A858_9ZZZZ